MTQGTFFRAATAYRRQLAHELGRLVHQAAVVAGMRVRDYNTYVPDPRVVPKDVRRMRTQLRELWAESRPLVRDAAWFMEDTDQQALQDFEDEIDWNDPLPLSRLAVGLRPKDPLARVSLATSWMDQRGWDQAFDCLNRGFNYSTHVPGALSRLLRNLACVLEQVGNVEGALSYSRLAWKSSENDLICLLDWIGFSIFAGDRESLRESIRVIARDSGSIGLVSLLIQTLKARKDKEGVSLSSNPSFQRIVREELRVG